MTESLISKYNTPVPRYTSYPPANYFAPYAERDYLLAVDASNRAADRHLSFYLHLPFCPQMCHYCGCNSYPMPAADVVERYVEAMHREIALVIPHLDPTRRIAQIHYGGGTPSALPLHHIRALNEQLLSAFGTIDSPEIAIECHPAYLTADHWAELTRCGFTRFSIGIQDLRADVLRAVHRRPSLLPLPEVFGILRSAGARINLDFLYGLPRQTADSFADSVARAIALQPDRLVTFSYAHVPWVNPRQRILERRGLPAVDVKNDMFRRAESLLADAGYHRIGMDHFVRPDDELYTALTDGRLHRNFQGYCTRRTTGQVYAFGITGISQLESAYAQNTKQVDDYIQAIASGYLPTRKGYTLSSREQLTGRVIESLMCNYRIDWQLRADTLPTPPDALRSATAYDPHRMAELAADGLITFTPLRLDVTPAGAPFVRNVAAALDPLMADTTKTVSKPL
jgi:oxygen-independent coproporphyrinogen-3 oxidase